MIITGVALYNLVIELATQCVLDDAIIANDPHLEEVQKRQGDAIAVVDRYFYDHFSK
jgi:hypothetical protein